MRTHSRSNYQRSALLCSEEIKAIATLLYEQIKLEQIESLGKIEETIKEKNLQCIIPQLGVLRSDKLHEQEYEELKK